MTYQNSNNYIFNNCYNMIKDRKPHSGFDDTSLINELLELFDDRMKTLVYFDFYLDYKNALPKHAFYLLKKIKLEYIDLLLKLIEEEHIKILNVFMLDEERLNKISQLLGGVDINLLTPIFSGGLHKCELCNNYYTSHSNYKNKKCNCKTFDYCKICNKNLFNLKQLREHYTKIHNINFFEKYPEELEKFVPQQYCSYCGEPLERKANILHFKLCQNRQCVEKQSRVDTFVKHFKNTRNNHSEEEKEKIRQNYSNASYQREKKFRENILEDGNNQKYHIMKKAGEKISKEIKQRIQDGKFTPCATNSWARSLCKFKDYRFRSSFELFFKWLDSDNLLEYEKTRIPYFYKNKKHNYITDFTDEVNKIIYEIKPKCNLEKELNILKEKVAIEWCKENGYTYKIITEEYLIENIDILMDIFNSNKDILDEDTLRKCNKSLKGLINESIKNNRN